MAWNQEEYNEKYSAQAKMEAANRESELEAQRKEDAETAGVQDARFIDYADVLARYEARPDTEHLAARRARHYASNASEQDFTREAGYKGVTGPDFP